MSEKVLVLGASLNESRYSNIATKMLREYGHEVLAIGNKIGSIGDVEISKEPIDLKDIDTVTLYLNPLNQEPYKNYILGLHPKRVIFNPGTENYSFQKQLEENGILSEVACTLVLLRTSQFETVV